MHFSLRYLISAWAIFCGSFSPVFAWYQSPQALYEFCKTVQFENPVCPRLTGLYEVYASPQGKLTDQSLLLAATALRLDRPALGWLEEQNLSGSKPAEISEELWRNAQWTYAQALYLQKKFPESLKTFDELNDHFKRRSIFHQQRAWAQYFSGKYELALGSIISAESPLVEKVPFIRKYLLRALIERDTCQYAKAFQTISEGRKSLQAQSLDVEGAPFVKICRNDQDQRFCGRISDWYKAQYQEEVQRALQDLDYLEAELTEKGRKTADLQAIAAKPIAWPFIGEAWLDELGHYSVDILVSCGEGEKIQ